jgi:hypothetical protein
MSSLWFESVFPFLRRFWRVAAPNRIGALYAECRDRSGTPHLLPDHDVLRRSENRFRNLEHIGDAANADGVDDPEVLGARPQTSTFTPFASISFSVSHVEWSGRSARKTPPFLSATTEGGS